MTRSSLKHLTLILLALLTLLSCSDDQKTVAPTNTLDTLEQNFSTPPNQARPRTWWHWLGGNISKDGIEKDLAWMNKIGIGGVQNFTADLNTPKIIETPISFMSPAWTSIFQFALVEANNYGMEFAIAGSPGWSETGGPWVSPQDGMKKMIWSETLVKASQNTKIILPLNKTTTGHYQDIPLSAGNGEFDHSDNKNQEYYRDISVLAFPTNGNVISPDHVHVRNGKIKETAHLYDRDFQSIASLPRRQNTVSTLYYSYNTPVTIRSANLHIPNAKPPFHAPIYLPVLEVKTDQGWETVSTIPLSEVPTTISFTPVTSSQFRLKFPKNKPSASLAEMGIPGAVQFDFFFVPQGKNFKITEFTLSSAPKVHRASLKAGYTITPDYNVIKPTPKVSKLAIQFSDIIDLSDKINKEGQVQWTPPKDGRDWKIVRYGYSLTGKNNHPTPPEDTGLEVDKYDADAVRRYLDHYIGMHEKAAGPSMFGAKGLTAFLTDSIEIGPSNWTHDMAAKFEARRGYSLALWMPALGGEIIGNAAQTDAFLNDFRQTLSELLASEHYKTIADYTDAKGLNYYNEALENKRPVLGDDIAIREYSDVPMAALWAFNKEDGPLSTTIGDMRGAASVANLYGQKHVAAESMTSAFSPWAFAPSDLKKMVDMEFVNGINRIVIHTSVHQPSDALKPGLTLAIFGQYFNRHETWADMAGPWVEYMARTSHLLQQGRTIADIAYFAGDDMPITVLYANTIPTDLPKNHGYDFINTKALKQAVRIKNGNLTTKAGANYNALYIGQNATITLDTLEAINTLIQQGATVIGSAPSELSSLQSLRHKAGRFDALITSLWTDNQTGKGRVITSTNIDASLASIGMSPDVSIAATTTGQTEMVAKISWLHRKTKNADLYFLSNPTDQTISFDAQFRASFANAEIWNAVDGSQTISPTTQINSLKSTELTLRPDEAVFVVFRNGHSTSAKPRRTALSEIKTIHGQWSVDLNPKIGDQISVVLDTLIPLNEHENVDIRYFSGTSDYKTSFELESEIPKGLTLDLGKIGDVAEIYINDRLVGTSWYHPHQLDVSAFVQTGKNALEIRVANLWVNRLIGDAQPNAIKTAKAFAPTYLPHAPLRPAGLIGPVRLMSVDKK